MGRAKYEVASDGYRARLAPPWTEEKLRILSCYLAGFARACRSARGWCAIDLFAGGGLNISETTGDEIPGSTVRILEAKSPEATRVIAVEQDAGLAEALRARVASFGHRCEVLNADGIEAMERVLDRVDPRAPTFAFLDPEGSELAWSAVAAIAAHKRPPRKRIEQLILFPTDTGFVRLLSLNSPLDRDHAARVTQMFGHARWHHVWERRRAGRLSAAQAREEYVRMYAEGLQGLGYESVQERRITGDRGQPMYYLLFATDHRAGQSIMTYCFDKRHFYPAEERGQQRLPFPVKVHPRNRIV